MNWADQTIGFLALGLITMHQGHHAWDRGEQFLGILFYLMGILESIVGFYLLAN